MKKFVCFALVFTILINVIGFGFMNVNASAEAVAATVAILGIIGSAVLNGCANSLGSTIVAKMDTIDQNIMSRINEQAIQKGEIIQLVAQRDLYGNYTDDTIYFVPAADLSADEQAFADYLCLELNNSESKRKIVQGFEELYFGTGGLPATLYSQLKTDSVNAYYDYLANKYINDAMAGEAWKSNYSFDWTNGGTPQIQLPNVTEYVQSTYGGWVLSKAYLNQTTDGGFTTREAAEAAGGTSISQFGSSFYPKTIAPGYGCGQYCIYNGEIFYHVSRRANYANSGYMTIQVDDNLLNVMYNSKGETLASKGCTTTVGLMCGYYYGSEAHTDCNYPSSVTEDDVKSTTSGGIVDIGLPKTDITLLSAMKSGLLTPDSLLGISPEGEITGADGITLAQLQQMLDDLAAQLNTDIDLSSLEEYLQAIRIACSKGLTAEQLNTALNNVKSSIKDYSGDLGAILTAINGVKALDETQADTLSSIEEQTRAIAEAIAAVNEYELEVEKDDAEIDYYSVEHTGLAEAAAFVAEDDLVNQVKGLLYNILDPQEYSSGAPNFEFYYDSDKDGVAETYNAFDLSFLETPLTNANLKDKRHFTQPMTVREFIQYLIIFICYVGFALKVLRKLPGLFNGGESTAQDGLTMQAIESGKTLKSHIKGE